MNKKGEGGDFLSIGYFMFLLFIIGATIFFMAKVVLGVAYDSRLTDASLLGYKIEKCLSEKDLKESDITNIKNTCGIQLKDAENKEKKFVLHIYTKEKEFFKYGDKISCGLYALNNKNARCITFSTNGKVNGKETEFYITTGSNLEVDKT